MYLGRKARKDMTKARHNGRRKASALGKTMAGRSAHVMERESLAVAKCVMIAEANTDAPKSFCDAPDYFVDWVMSRSNLYVAADVLQPRQTGSCASRLSSRVLSAAPLDRRQGNNV